MVLSADLIHYEGRFLWPKESPGASHLRVLDLGSKSRNSRQSGDAQEEVVEKVDPAVLQRAEKYQKKSFH